MIRWLLPFALAACSSPSKGVTSADGGDPDSAQLADSRPLGDAPVHTRELAFAANYVAGISGFEIQPDGQLVAMQPATFEPSRHFFGVAAHPSLPVVYAAEYTGHAIDAFRIDPHTGALALIGEPVAIAHAAIAIAVDPLGRFVYVGDFDDVELTHMSLQVFAIGADGGLAAQPLFTLPRTNAVDAIAAAPSGTTVYTTDAAGGIRAYAVAAGGALSERTDSPFAAQTVTGGWMTFHPTKDILYTARTTLQAFAAETSGTLAAVEGSPFGAGANADPGEMALAIDRRGRFACVVDMPAGTVTVHALNADGAMAVPGTTYDAGTFAYSVAIDLDGRYVYVATDFGSVAAFAVDPDTLALTPLAGSPMISAVGNAPQLIVVRGV